MLYGTTKDMVENSSWLQPSIHLHAIDIALMFSCSGRWLLSMYYCHEWMKARASPEQSIEPHIILAPIVVQTPE